MSRRPLLWCAATFAAGIAAPSVLVPGASSTIAFVLLLGGIALHHVVQQATTLHSGERLAGERIAIAFLLAGFFSAGSLAGSVAEMPAESIDRLAARHDEKLREGAEVTGTLARAARVRIDPPRHELLVDVERVRLGPIRHRVTGRILLTAPASSAPAELGRGDRVTFFGSLRLPAAARSPGAFDSRRHLLARGIHLTGRLKSWALLRGAPVDNTRVTQMLRRLDSLREGILGSIASAFPDDDRGRRATGVCMAMLLGERALSPHDEETLARAGLNHLLAVSGFNVAILAAATLLVLRCLGVGVRWAWVGTLPILIVYLLMNSEESSVRRAVAMAGAFLVGRACWKRADLFNVLGCSAMVLLAASPLQIGDPGFQLTFVATLALLLAGSLPLDHAETGALRWLIASVAGTMAATLATLPLVAIHFHRVAPAALPANLIAGPMMAAAFVASLFLPLAALVADGFSVALADHVVLPLIDGVFFIAKGIVSFPGMSWRVPGPSGLWVAAYFLSGVAAFMMRRSDRHSRQWGLRARAAAILWVVSLAIIALPRDTRARPAGLAITMLDVGQGDSLLVETTAGERILVDAGGSTGSTFDVGERIVSPALWNMGIVRLDAAVVTHADRDHAGGMAAILRNFRPRELWLAGLDGGGAVIRSLAAEAEALGTRVRPVHAGDALCRKGARVAILSAGGAGRNDSSIVMRVSSRGRHILLMGDAGHDTEARLAGAGVGADVLKVGHHGSRTATTDSFLSSVKPSIAMISCGRGNRFGHPHREVIARLERSGITACRTDLDGTLGAVLMRGATLLSAPCREPQNEIRKGKGAR